MSQNRDETEKERVPYLAILNFRSSFSFSRFISFQLKIEQSMIQTTTILYFFVTSLSFYSTDAIDKLSITSGNKHFAEIKIFLEKKYIKGDKIVWMVFDDKSIYIKYCATRVLSSEIDSSIWTSMIRLELCIDSIPQGRCNITTAIQRASKYSKLVENFLKISRERIL